MGIERRAIGKRPLEKVLPQQVSRLPAQRVIKCVAVGARVERRKRHRSPRQCCPSGTSSRGAVDPGTDRRWDVGPCFVRPVWFGFLYVRQGVIHRRFVLFSSFWPGGNNLRSHTIVHWVTILLAASDASSSRQALRGHLYKLLRSGSQPIPSFPCSHHYGANRFAATEPSGLPFCKASERPASEVQPRPSRDRERDCGAGCQRRQIGRAHV